MTKTRKEKKKMKNKTTNAGRVLKILNTKTREEVSIIIYDNTLFLKDEAFRFLLGISQN